MRHACLIASLLFTLSIPAYAADTTVTENDLSFDRETLNLETGDTVTFINRDEVSHNLQVVNPEVGNVISDKGLQKPGGQTQITFSTPGIYRVRCSISPQMKMSVSVR
jgi:plastocyanin